MKKAAVLFIFLLTVGSLSAANRQKRIPFFEFTQIDSLANQAINEIILRDSSSLIVVSVEWQIGSYVSPKNKKDAEYSNPFLIYLLFSKNGKYYIQLIDNFGYFVPKIVEASSVQNYLLGKFEEMQYEKIGPKVDTIYNADGKISTIITITDHQLSEQIKIYYNKKHLDYKFRASDAENPKNLLLNQYKFLVLLRELQKQFKSIKQNRIKYLYKLTDENE